MFTDLKADLLPTPQGDTGKIFIHISGITHTTERDTIIILDAKSHPNYDGKIVLCYWTNRKEYVVWTMFPETGLQWGHYFGNDIEAAVKCFKRLPS